MLVSIEGNIGCGKLIPLACLKARSIVQVHLLSQSTSVALEFGHRNNQKILLRSERQNPCLEWCAHTSVFVKVSILAGNVGCKVRGV